MAAVVSDTSPIRALSHLGHLAWLGDLFGQVVVPPAVAGELERPPRGLAAVELSAWRFIAVENPTNRVRVSELCTSLDLGEAEAIALAEEIKAEAVLIDELAGRKAALDCGLTVIGTLGIVLRAKQLGLCPAVSPLLDRLRRETKFFIGPTLLEQVLKQAGEG